jgi:hypothetical protein
MRFIVILYVHGLFCLIYLLKSAQNERVWFPFVYLIKEIHGFRFMFCMVICKLFIYVKVLYVTKIVCLV